MGQDNYVEETSFSIHEEVPEFAQRRAESRLLTLLRVGTIIIDGRRELCLIRNISALGLMLHVYSHLDEGQRVEVEMKTGQHISGCVKWVRDSTVGLAFDEAIDVMAILASQLLSQTDLKPRMPRVEVRCPATLRMGGHTYRVTTRDISQGGAKVTLDTVLPPDADIVLSMEGFHSLHGVLRWCDGDFAGLTFNAVIPWPQLVRWLKDRRDAGPPKEAWRPRPKADSES